MEFQAQAILDQKAKEDIIPTKPDLFFTVINMVTTVLALVLPFFFYSQSAIIAFVIFYTITGLGLTMGYHRLFAHHSFRVPLWLEHAIAISGYLAIQRGPIFWSAMHRMHHKYSDIPGKDPHTPKEGIWHVHFGWTHHRRQDIWDQRIYKKYAPDLMKSRLYRWMDHEVNDYITYVFLVAGSFVLGGFIESGFQTFDTYNAWCFLVWIGILNRVALLHAFGLINSVCHLVGSRPYHSSGQDTSKNNLLVALLIFGEGWHNNHHAFPSSAKQGLKWYQIDPAWYTIWLLKKLGLARDVKVPSSRVLEKRKVK